MQYRITIRKVMAIVAVLIGSIAALAMREPSQSTSSLPTDQARKIRDLPVVDFDAPAPNDLRHKARGSRYDRQSSQPIQETSSISGRLWSNHWARGLEALPIDSSDTILVGTITDAQAHLSNDKTAVYSEFHVQVEEVLKQDPAKSPIELTAAILIERFGGAVRFSSGTIQRYETIGQGMPRSGERYLLFLKRLDEAPSFSIITGYELGYDLKVFPLDGAHVGEGNDTYPFDKYKGFDTSLFLQTVRTRLAEKSKSAL